MVDSPSPGSRRARAPSPVLALQLRRVRGARGDLRVRVLGQGVELVHEPHVLRVRRKDALDHWHDALARGALEVQPDHQRDGRVCGAFHRRIGDVDWPHVAPEAHAVGALDVARREARLHAIGEEPRRGAARVARPLLLDAHVERHGLIRARRVRRAEQTLEGRALPGHERLHVDAARRGFAARIPRGQLDRAVGLVPVRRRGAAYNARDEDHQAVRLIVRRSTGRILHRPGRIGLVRLDVWARPG